MSPSQVATLMTVLLAAGLVTFAVAAVVPDLRRRFAERGLVIAAVVALGATIGSLYLSEIANFIPCKMCWYQRIAMYPLGVMLPIAALRRDRGVWPYALVLAGAGAAVSLNHIRLQEFPPAGGSCSLTDPCTVRWTDVFGFVTIPQMALAAFVLVAGSGVLAMTARR